MEVALSPSAIVTSTVSPGCKSSVPEQALKAKKHTAASTMSANTPRKMTGFGSRLGMMALVS